MNITRQRVERILDRLVSARDRLVRADLDVMRHRHAPELASLAAARDNFAAAYDQAVETLCLMVREAGVAA